MVSTCANHGCLAKFLYLHDGKLFSLESQPTSDSSVAGAVEYFWLCRKCSTTMTLVFDPGNGVRVTIKPNVSKTTEPIIPLIEERRKRSGDEEAA